MRGDRQTRFPIRFDRGYRLLSRALRLSPSESYLDVDPVAVRVHMAWAFRAHFPRSAILSTSMPATRPATRGVHGWAGRWLVNGSGDGLLAIDLEPPQQAFVLGFPVRLRQLTVSVEDPATLAKALTEKEEAS